MGISGLRGTFGIGTFGMATFGMGTSALGTFGLGTFADFVKNPVVRFLVA